MGCLTKVTIPSALTFHRLREHSEDNIEPEDSAGDVLTGKVICRQ